MIAESELNQLRLDCTNKDGQRLLVFGVSMIDLIGEALAGRRLVEELRTLGLDPDACQAIREWHSRVGPLPVAKPQQHEWVGPVRASERTAQQVFDERRADLEKHMLSCIMQWTDLGTRAEIQLGDSDYMIFLQGGWSGNFRGVAVRHVPGSDSMRMVNP